MDPCVPIPLDEKTLEDIVEKAKDFCLMKGKQNLNKLCKHHECLNSILRILEPSR